MNKQRRCSKQIVTAVFDKVSRTVNVTADSGTAMIRDIVNRDARELMRR